MGLDLGSARLTAPKAARNIVRIRMNGRRQRCRQRSGLSMSTEAARAASDDKIRCDACPVMCYIKPGAAGACDRYANHDGKLVRVDPHIVMERTVSHGGKLVTFQAGGELVGEI